VTDFLTNNATHLRAVAASGNRNFGSNYGKASALISEQFGVPDLGRFELSGSPSETAHIREGIEQVEQAYRAK
jgi:protein involved in ribonucleotide reduction